VKYKLFADFHSFLPWCRRLISWGNAGEVVKVAPGHFRNHLMPKMLAVPNMDKYAILIREQGKVRFFPSDPMFHKHVCYGGSCCKA
jgi:hypothetical protein